VDGARTLRGRTKRVLALLALTLALTSMALSTACGGSEESESARAVPEVEIKGLAFTPRSVSVKVGSEVHWRFADKGTAHNVTADDGSFKSATMASGAFTHAFQAPGRVTYRCTVHPAQMQGSVEVRA
jgi:plastocyanin